MGKIEEILKKNKFSYEFIHNAKPILTAKEGAGYYGIGIGQMAPALILYTAVGYYVLVISGDRGHVDFKIIKHMLKCKNVRMANKEEVKSITGFDVGNVPMVGIGLPYIIDKRLLAYDFVYGGTGDESITLKIDPKALSELNNVVGTID
ncbi:MAG: aminoacyl-tRNA deacylase [Clostridiaceae bacterium]